MSARLHEFLRFCIVGFIGYAIDAALLELFIRAGVPVPLGRVLSIALAMQCTYVLHGAFTYRAHSGLTRRNWLRFMASNAFGAFINYSVFLLMLHVALTGDAMLHRQLAVLSGTAVALGFNYWANRRFVFNHRA